MTNLTEEPRVMPALDLQTAESGIFNSDSGMLMGGRCTQCGSQSLPANFICYSCSSTDIAPVEYRTFGTLYSYTTVHISPSLPTPYTLGYVDLESGLRILGHILIETKDLDCNLPVVGKAAPQSPTGWGFELDTERIH
jgi:uncharacterized OB-fold protein